MTAFVSVTWSLLLEDLERSLLNLEGPLCQIAVLLVEDCSEGSLSNKSSQNCDEKTAVAAYRAAAGENHTFKNTTF